MDITLFSCASATRLVLAAALLITLWLLTGWSVALS